MRTYEDLEMGKTEILPVSLRVRALQTGETVSSAAITHTPPSGSPVTMEFSVETPYINMLLGPFAVAGYHFVMVQAVGSADPPSKPETLYIIRVR